MTSRSSPAPVAADPAAPRLCFLVIDTRFAVPVFVFLDSDPTGAAGYAGPPARRVTLSGAPGQRLGEGVEPWRTVGADPERGCRFAEFASDGQARAAGYAPVEPRYVGPDWASYTSVFHPEGAKAARPAADPVRRPQGRNGAAYRSVGGAR